MGLRQSYQLTHLSNKRTFSLDWTPLSLSIMNTSKFPCYVNIGAVDYPSRLSFTDVIAPYSSFVADPTGARDFAVFIDTSTDPSSPFNFPVTVTFSTGAASVQAALSLNFATAAAQSAYISKIMGVQPLYLLDLWPLNEIGGSIAGDNINTARNGVYVNSPVLGTVTGPDGTIKTPVFNGTNQYVNVLTPSLQSAFDHEEGTLLVWVQMTIAKWNDANPYQFMRISAGAVQIEVSKNAANKIIGSYRTQSVNPTITPSNNWFPVVLTWSRAANNLKLYVNGAIQGTTFSLDAWVGAIDSANIGANNVPANFLPGSLALAAIWFVRLDDTEVTTISSIP